MIGQRHFGRRKTAHARERLQAEDGGEVVLPGTDVQPEILSRRGGRDRVAPGGSRATPTARR